MQPGQSRAQVGACGDTHSIVHDCSVVPLFADLTIWAVCAMPDTPNNPRS